MCSVSPVVKQFLAVVCCNILAFSYGLSNFWATINLNDLRSENCTFSTGQLSKEQMSIVVSISNVGGLIGNFLILPIGQAIGIKQTIHLLSIPMIISSICTIWAQNVYYLYVARVMIGLVGGGIVVGVPALVNDISFDNVRGALNSLYDVFNNTGIIVSFLLGSYVSIVNQAKIQLIPPILFMISLFYLPESPDYFICRNKEKRAIKSCRFYKGHAAAVQKATKVDFILVPQNEPDAKKGLGIKKSLDQANDINSPVSLKDFCTPHAKKSIFIAFTSLILCYFSGSITIVSYVTYIFKETGSKLTEKESALMISITQLVSNMLFLVIVERFNRRTLYIWSALFTTASFFLFGAYGYFWLNQPGYDWMPPFFFGCIIFFGCLGLRPIPYIITMEIFPQKIRRTCLALAVSSLWIILFALASVFFTLVELIGLFNFLIALGVICLLNALFAMFFVIETRGKSFEEIEELLS